MRKLLFAPVRFLAGLLAAAISKRLFGAIWRRIDRSDPPQPQHRAIHLGKLALALGLDGALARMVRGLVDHGSRKGFASLTGGWPGEEAPPAAPADGAAEPVQGAASPQA